jgi:hypothetical protein
MRFAVSHKLHFASIQTKAPKGKPKPVWIIGAWNLDIFCYLKFGAWNFLYLKANHSWVPVPTFRKYIRPP